MTHICLKEFIPLADAFEEAVQASRLCIAAIRSIDSAATEPAVDKPVAENEGSSELPPGFVLDQTAREPNSFEKYDQAARQIEMSMREAITDGTLPVFNLTPSGLIVQLERDRWRQMSFGVPGFEYVPHHLTSPGPDTGGYIAYLRKSDFYEWLSKCNPDLSLSAPLSAPKKIIEIDSALYPIMSDLLANGKATSIAEAARQVAPQAKNRGGTLESVSKRLERGYSRQQKVLGNPTKS